MVAHHSSGVAGRKFAVEVVDIDIGTVGVGDGIVVPAHSAVLTAVVDYTSLCS